MDVNNLLKKSENMVASRGVSKVVSRVVTRNLFRGVTGYFIFWGSKLWCTSRGVYLLKTDTRPASSPFFFFNFSHFLKKY